MIFENNKIWDIELHKAISIIIPVFNREAMLDRCLSSVANLRDHNHEVVIIDDGSTDKSVDVAKTWILQLNCPAILFVKKNGGVHTARNLGIKKARGKFVLFLDSDDEILPDAINLLVSAYKNNCYKKKYFRVCGHVITPDGKLHGKSFPWFINLMPRGIAYALKKWTKGEHAGIIRRDLLEDHAWPEPEGVKFVTERVLWDELWKKYDGFFIDEAIMIYHTENEISLSNSYRTIQRVKDFCWMDAYYVDNPSKYHLSFLKWLYYLIKYCVRKRSLCILGVDFIYEVDSPCAKKISYFISPIIYCIAKKYVSKISDH